MGLLTAGHVRTRTPKGRAHRGPGDNVRTDNGVSSTLGADVEVPSLYRLFVEARRTAAAPAVSNSLAARPG